MATLAGPPRHPRDAVGNVDEKLPHTREEKKSGKKDKDEDETCRYTQRNGKETFRGEVLVAYELLEIYHSVPPAAWYVVTEE